MLPKCNTATSLYELSTVHRGRPRIDSFDGSGAEGAKPALITIKSYRSLADAWSLPDLSLGPSTQRAARTHIVSRSTDARTAGEGIGPEGKDIGPAFCMSVRVESD